MLLQAILYHGSKVSLQVKKLTKLYERYKKQKVLDSVSKIEAILLAVLYKVFKNSYPINVNIS